MENKKSEIRNPREKKCYLCGNSDFVWGKLISDKNGDSSQHIFFREESYEIDDGDIPVFVRHCNTCNNIVIFAVDS